jgi:hypothetical protein
MENTYTIVVGKNFKELGDLGVIKKKKMLGSCGGAC